MQLDWLKRWKEVDWKEVDWNRPIFYEEPRMDDLSYLALYINIAITIIIAIRFCIAAARWALLQGVNNSLATGPPAAAHHGKSTVLSLPSPVRSVRVAPSNLAATQGSQPFNLEEIPGFLTPSECAAVIAMAQKRGLKRSMVSGSDGKGGYVSTSRTSYGTFCSSAPVIQTIQERVGDLLGSGHPWFGGYENLQVVRYEAGQAFDAHMDSTPRSASEGGMVERVATCLIYLNDDFAGGETHFPSFNMPGATSGFTVTPEAGKAVLWFNHRPGDGSSLAPHARHAGLQVLSGQKWMCTQFITAGVYADKPGS